MFVIPSPFLPLVRSMLASQAKLKSIIIGSLPLACFNMILLYQNIMQEHKCQVLVKGVNIIQ